MFSKQFPYIYFTLIVRLNIRLQQLKKRLRCNIDEEALKIWPIRV